MNSFEDLNIKDFEFTDREITCCDCDAKFVFTKGEQEYFAEKGLTDKKRCGTCTKKRREYFRSK